MINDLNYEGIKLPVSKKDYCRIERQNNICINVFCYENNLTYPVYVSDEKFENCMDLLLMSDENFANVVYNVLVVIEHIENCLIVNGKQSVKLKSSSISFKNYFK